MELKVPSGIELTRDIKVAVIGDIMIDRYLVGDYNRNSPEADIPLLSIKHHKDSPGGAANVAMNLKAMGLESIILSMTGADSDGALLCEILSNQRVASYILKDESRRTTCKTRVVDGQYRQYVRFDHEDRHLISEALGRPLLERLEWMAENASLEAVILQDYNKGLVSPQLIDEVQKLCANHGLTLLVDPKNINFEKLSKCDFFKPNLKECKDWLTMEDGESIEAYLSRLRQKLTMPDNLVVTLGERGMYYTDGTIEGQIEGYHIDNPDVSGAGDTVIAAICCFHLEGKPLEDICRLANKAGALACRKKGVATVTLDEIMGDKL